MSITRILGIIGGDNPGESPKICADEITSIFLIPILSVLGFHFVKINYYIFYLYNFGSGYSRREK